MGESCPKLLDLIPKEREWGINREGDEGLGRRGSACDENKKLELRLGLPGDEGWSQKTIPKTREKNGSLLSLNNHFPDQKRVLPINNHSPWPCSGYQVVQAQQQQSNTASQFLVHHHHNHQYQISPNGLPAVTKESSQPCCTRIADLQNAEKKAISPPSASTDVPNASQKRSAPAPVVGWPPIRSFRKNLASSSSAKSVSEPQNPIPTKPANEKPDAQNSRKGLFIKINMDGVPIGRKVDLNAYDSYEKLSSAVNELFRGLLAGTSTVFDLNVSDAQRDSPAGGIDNNQEEQKQITGLLDGSGEYTLVYEDNEGDRMLVGDDVPWHMFVSTVKRLRVLKSSDLPTLGCCGSKNGKGQGESASK